MGGSPTPSVLCALAFYFVSLLGLVQIVRAQNGTTPPSEVSALNSVFSQWGLSPTYYQWNISGEPCSGAAIDTTATTALEVTFGDYNPGIKCDCNGTVCHITQLAGDLHLEPHARMIEEYSHKTKGYYWLKNDIFSKINGYYCLKNDIFFL